MTKSWYPIISAETCGRCYDTGENLAAEVKRLRRALRRLAVGDLRRA